MVNPVAKPVHRQLPGYFTPAEIADAISRFSGQSISVYTILHGISGRRSGIALFAYKSQGRYWIPNNSAYQFIRTGLADRNLVPEILGQELPGYYTPGEIARELEVTSLTILHAIRGRPDRGKPPTLNSYLAQNRYWIPEQDARDFISRRRNLRLGVVN